MDGLSVEEIEKATVHVDIAGVADDDAPGEVPDLDVVADDVEAGEGPGGEGRGRGDYADRQVVEASHECEHSADLSSEDRYWRHSCSEGGFGHEEAEAPGWVEEQALAVLAGAHEFLNVDFDLRVEHGRHFPRVVRGLEQPWDEGVVVAPDTGRVSLTLADLELHGACALAQEQSRSTDLDAQLGEAIFQLPPRLLGRTKRIGEAAQHLRGRHVTAGLEAADRWLTDIQPLCKLPLGPTGSVAQAQQANAELPALTLDDRAGVGVLSLGRGGGGTRGHINPTWPPRAA